MSENYIELKIRDLAKSKGFTLKKLCQLIDITEQGFGTTFKNGTLKVETLKKISDVLEVPITTFFSDEVQNRSLFINFFKISREETIDHAAGLRRPYESYLINIYKRTLLEEHQIISYLMEIFSNLDIKYYKDGIQKPIVLKKLEEFKDTIVEGGEIFYEILPKEILMKVDHKFIKITQSFFKNVLHDPVFELLLKEQVLDNETIFTICNSFLNQYYELSKPAFNLRRIDFSSYIPSSDLEIES